ncbi:MAG: hypothetical protein A2V88_03840 [Elusimicrobia bacterium RBG_16_66_12]|nr:MAG: hypothetical protein A2V88_03840 [Elusimicrobia bacterium RBG_16_66_12]
MNINRFPAVIMAAVAVAALAACATKQPSAPIAVNAPEWVNKGSGAFKDTAGKQVFYGVGIAQGIRNRALAVTAADDRGRAEIAKIMNSYVTTLTKDYMASVTAGDMSKSSEEQMVSTTMKNFAKFTLHGALPVDHWKDPSDGTLFSLVKLDMSAVQASLAESKDLDAKVRDYVKANAEKAFDELSAEEAKH